MKKFIKLSFSSQMVVLSFKLINQKVSFAEIHPGKPLTSHLKDYIHRGGIVPQQTNNPPAPKKKSQNSFKKNLVLFFFTLLMMASSKKNKKINESGTLKIISMQSTPPQPKLNS
jgi:hypothetical protein